MQQSTGGDNSDCISIWRQHRIVQQAGTMATANRIRSKNQKLEATPVSVTLRRSAASSQWGANIRVESEAASTLNTTAQRSEQ